MKRISIGGFVSVTFYLAFVLYLHLDAKHCSEIDGLFCGFGYFVAGFPWSWLFSFIADVFMTVYPPSTVYPSSVEQSLLWGVFIASVIINSFIVYFIGRYIGNVLVRLGNGVKSNSAT